MGERADKILNKKIYSCQIGNNTYFLFSVIFYFIIYTHILSYLPVCYSDQYISLTASFDFVFVSEDFMNINEFIFRGNIV